MSTHLMTSLSSFLLLEEKCRFIALLPGGPKKNRTRNKSAVSQLSLRVEHQDFIIIYFKDTAREKSIGLAYSIYQE